jgi:hypothetical protein
MTGKKADDTFKGRVVIQRMIREVGGGTSYLALTKTNYSDSALLMKLKLRVLRTDHENEFTVREFVEYCAIENVHRQHTTPYNAQQNSGIEHQNGTVVATAMSMLKAKGLPGWYMW